MQSVLVSFTRKSERNSSEVSCSGPATVKANGARTFREILSSPEDVSVPIASHLFANPFFFCLFESTYSKCIQTWQGQGLDWRKGNALLKKKKNNNNKQATKSTLSAAVQGLLFVYWLRTKWDRSKCGVKMSVICCPGVHPTTVNKVLWYSGTLCKVFSL